MMDKSKPLQPIWDRSIAILYHEVPNPNITIRNFFIAVWRLLPLL
jgi:hypothetical protein